MIVLDASALVDVICDQDSKEWVLGQLDDRVVAPAHQPAEVLSAIARLVRAGSMSAEEADAALVEAAGLDQELVVSTGSHLREAFALRDRVRVLDGLYVALARERRVPLVTTDPRLAGAALPVEVLSP